jgi:CRP-like cAMP-binding protein
MRPLEQVLIDVPFFEGLPAETLARLAGCASNVRFEGGELLFRRGEAADAFYVIRGGTVALETVVPAKRHILIETLEEGEVVGWSWLFEPYRWHLDGRAVSPVRATAFDAACLRAKCDADPALGYELMRRFAEVLIERLQWTRLRLIDVYGNDTH